MTVIDDLRTRLRPGGVRAVAPGATAAPPEDEATRELRARREELAGRVAELTFDLGGLAYEMAIRDHFRLDVLVKRAATLQAADAELGETERLLKMEETGTTGTCRKCGALHSRGALFCWQCGSGLMEVRPVSGA